MGRRSKLTPDLQAEFVKTIRAGALYNETARHVGVAVQTVWHWMALGEQQRSGPYYEFREAVVRARADAEIESLGRIRHAGRGGGLIERVTKPDGTVVERFAPPDWRADAWYLERTQPSKYGRFTRTELTTPESAPALEENIDEARRESVLVKLDSYRKRRKAASE